jgi:hypothetical protein
VHQNEERREKTEDGAGVVSPCKSRVIIYTTYMQFKVTDCNNSPGRGIIIIIINPLTPNDLYMSRTAPRTSKSWILYIYSTNVGTEYFKHALYSPFFSLQNTVCFIMLTCLDLYYSNFTYRVC